MRSKNFKPIGMYCNKKQFEIIKPKLIQIGEIGLLLGAFEDYLYLTNNYEKDKDRGIVFDFVGEGDSWAQEHNYNVHKEWNQELFLECCGIKVDVKHEITDSQLQELKYLLADDSHSGHHLRIEITKNILPELFKEEIQTITKEEAEKQLGKKIID